MEYLLFEKSAVERFASKTGFQSVEFELGKNFVDIILQNKSVDRIDNVIVKKDKGLLFVGKNIEKTFLVFDLKQCGLLEKETEADVILLILQKAFRTALRIWSKQPFSSSERVYNTKSIVFPFIYKDRRRFVIERSPDCPRLKKRGIEKPLLVYKYSSDEAPKGEEIANCDVLRNAGETYLSQYSAFQNAQRERVQTSEEQTASPLTIESAHQLVSDGGFFYLNYEKQLERLTRTQKSVVESSNIESPIRIDGPAGTGKTASLVLRAYRLLEKAYESGREFKIVFFAHSNSTKEEIERAFSIFENSSRYLKVDAAQSIKFTTLFDYCIETIGMNMSQVIEHDATQAKQTQRMLIEEALTNEYNKRFKTYKPLLSEELKNVFDSEKTVKGILISMLQHEFSVQIKGRTNGTIEEYLALPSIKNALPTMNNKDKEFVFGIYLEYQNMLRDSAVYDNDDITIQALSQWNAPIWRRERLEQGYDYIFVDEMHLFNINEQYTFHYLTKSTNQKIIPICFALDHSQAIGDRGDIARDYFEKNYDNVESNSYKTVFRSSQQITDFCASISASGALMFQNDYKNPYTLPLSGFTENEDKLSRTPSLFMYENDELMIDSIKKHIDDTKKELQCKNYDIGIISFVPELLEDDNVKNLSEQFEKDITVLRDNYTSTLNRNFKGKDAIVLADPESVNGLEFKCVILIGVDEGRVPQTIGVEDVSLNYIRYVAFNQLYLTSSRAKYRLIVLGNSLHGTSSCLQYAIENGQIEVQDT